MTEKPNFILLEFRSNVLHLTTVTQMSIFLGGLCDRTQEIYNVLLNKNIIFIFFMCYEILNMKIKSFV